MGTRKILSQALFGAVLFAAGGFAFMSGSDAAAQKSENSDRLRIAKTARSTPSDDRETAAFRAAAAGNEARLASLEWSFGGKTQRGWMIYVPLISHTIGTASPPTTPAFAAALARWQKDRGRPATGTVDADTINAFISYWQSQRLGRSGTPEADKLLSAPIGEFFDRSRDANLLQVERETYTAYKRMLAAARKDLVKDPKANGAENYLSIVSAYRSPEYQAELRRKAPNSGRAALAKFSAHSTGQALDIYVGGEPVSTKDANRLIQVETPAYKWLVKNASRFGFYPYFYEPWHWEYVPARVDRKDSRSSK